MAVEITIPGGTDLPWAKFLPRVRSGLLGFYVFGGTLEESVINHVRGGAPLTVVGSPVIESNHARVTAGSHFFQTNFPDPAQHTFMAVARAAVTPVSGNAATEPVWIGNFNGAAMGQRGVSLTSRVIGGQPSIVHAIAADNAGSSIAVTSSVPRTVTDWHLAASGVDATTNRVRDLTGGGQDNDAIVGVRQSPTANNLRIGSAWLTFAGAGDIGLAAIWNRWISDDERAAMAADIRALMDARGIEGI